MTPTEQEATVAVDAAARVSYDQLVALRQEPGASAFDDAHAGVKHSHREAVLPFVWAALEALPDRAIAAAAQARAETIRQVQEHCCTCGQAGATEHEAWCVAAGVSDVLDDPTDDDDDSTAPG